MPQQELTKVQNLFIDKELATQRIDNFLFNKIKNVPKSRIYKMIRSGEVRVNKKRIAASYKLKSDDSVRIPPFWSDIKDKKTLDSPIKSGGDVLYRLIDLLLSRIIFEDKKILVINKPSGVASHGGSGINFGVIESLREARDDLKNLELAHRLDRDTSGCLILTKRKSALRELHRLTLAGKISKKYVLLVKGEWRGGEKKVDLPLLKNQLKSGERVVKVSEEGKKSVTIFKPIKIGSKVSLLEAKLKTGRTHQIRVHATHIGYPIVGDSKYGDKDFNGKMKKMGVNRLFLHAEKISFAWESGDRASFVAQLDDDFSGAMSNLF